MWSLTDLGRTCDEENEYRPIFRRGITGDQEYHIDFAEHVVQNETPFIVTVGTRMARRLQMAMIKKNTYKRILVVFFADDRDEQIPSDTIPNWPSHAAAYIYHLPMINPKIYPTALSMLQPHISKLGSLYSFSPNNLPPHIARRYQTMVSSARESGGMLLLHGGSDERSAFINASHDIITNTDALYSLPDCIRDNDHLTAAQRCHMRDTFILGGDKDNLHLITGILTLDYKEIAAGVTQVITDLAWDREPAPQRHMLRPEQIYFFYLNQCWLTEHSSSVSPHVSSLLGITIVQNPYDDDDFNTPPGGWPASKNMLEKQLLEAIG